MSAIRYFWGVTLCQPLDTSRELCCDSRQVLLGCYVVSALGTSRVLCCVSR